MAFEISFHDSLNGQGNGKSSLGAVYMSRASPVSRAEFSHENLSMTVTDNFNQLYDFLTTKLS